MGTAGGADPTFLSHPAGIAGRERRVRLPAIEGLRGKQALPARWPQLSRIAADRGSLRVLKPALPRLAGYRLVTSLPET
jgi:hypothetical protein